MELLHFVPLHEAQERACRKFVENGGRGIAWHKVGEGKSRIGLTVFATLQLLRDWEPPCILVVVCRRKAFHTWQDEIQKCKLDYFVYEWHPNNSSHEYDDAIPTVWLCSAAQVEKLHPNPYIRMVVVDELYLFKNYTVDRSKAIQKLADRYPTIGLSGSMMTAGQITDLYGQAAAIGVHKNIARTYTDFRTEYMMSFNTGGFPIHSAKRGAKDKVLEKIARFYDLHMPEKKDRKIHEMILNVPPTLEQKKMFKDMKDTWEIDDIEYDSAAALLIKNQQISNGFVRLTEEKVDGSKREYIREVASNKPEYLLGLLEEIVGNNEFCVVWCAFQHDVSMLSHYLAKNDIATLQMTGSHALDVQRFKTGAYHVVLATEGSGSSIDDFANIQYGIYYSQTFKWMDLQQSQGRHDRRSSQQKENFFYFLHTQGSLDRYIYDTVKNSQGQEQALINKADILQWLKDK